MSLVTSWAIWAASAARASLADLGTAGSRMISGAGAGGGTGVGAQITPIAFLVIKGESVRMLPIAAPASTTADRVVEQLPDLVDKLYAMIHPKSGDVE